MATNNGSLDLLKQHLGPGARANKYRIYLTIPTAAQVSGITDEAIDVLVQTAGMPDKTIGQQVEIRWNNRKEDGRHYSSRQSIYHPFFRFQREVLDPVDMRATFDSPLLRRHHKERQSYCFLC